MAQEHQTTNKVDTIYSILKAKLGPKKIMWMAAGLAGREKGPTERSETSERNLQAEPGKDQESEAQGVQRLKKEPKETTQEKRKGPGRKPNNKKPPSWLGHQVPPPRTNKRAQWNKW